MIAVMFVPFDLGRKTLGPFECERFNIAVGTHEARFEATTKTGAWWLSLPKGIYQLVCTAVE